MTDPESTREKRETVAASVADNVTDNIADDIADDPVISMRRRLGKLDPRQVAIWRAMTPAQRLELTFQAYQFALDAVRTTEKQRHSDLSPEELVWRDLGDRSVREIGDGSSGKDRGVSRSIPRRKAPPDSAQRP